jgi:hypothetical protein
VFNLKQNTSHYIAENDVQPATDFKIIRLARVRFEFEIHALGDKRTIMFAAHPPGCPQKSGIVCVL